MKEERDVHLIAACRAMAAAAAYSPAQPTPSRFSFSVNSTWGGSLSRPSSLNILNIVVLLRFLVFVFSFASALSLAAPSQKNRGGESSSSSSFYKHSELLYFFMVTILVFIYSAYQLFKGVYDLAFSGTLISSVASDYISFVLDQLGSYLIVSATSVAILTVENVRRHPPFWKATVASIVMSWVSFLMMVVCSAFSGYKLYKRIIW
ncbi:CASP-like protein 4A4 [Impatiens glandulifera]|uniref:CASP-like protein 4A4 n=1 Tax=Impatiens glandulifera TaxID=253017 RepID=UPI001FB140C1|nr:CASP-like protein 4A4 [Impatiens glandulifera]